MDDADDDESISYVRPLGALTVALMKSSVFRSRRNEDERWQLRSDTGREFHQHGINIARSSLQQLSFLVII